MVNMWKYISRNVRETFERRICSSLTDSPGQDKAKPCKFSGKLLPTVHSFCGKADVSDHQNKSARRNEKHEEKSQESSFNEAYIRNTWLGALGWSTAIVISWNVLQPLCRLQFSHEKERKCPWSRNPSSVACWKSHRDWDWKGHGAHHRFGHWPLNNRPENQYDQTDGVWKFNQHSYEKEESSFSDAVQTSQISNYSGIWKILSHTVWAQPSHILPLQAKEESKRVPASENTINTPYGPPTAEQVLDDAAENFASVQNSVLGDLENQRGVKLMQKGRHHEAVSLFTRAVDFSSASAAYNLGVCCEMGLGTKQNFKKAAKYYVLASKQGHATAMYNLGVFFVHGWGGLCVDTEEAHRLFQKASALGQKEAKQALEMVKVKEEPLQRYAGDETDSFDIVKQALTIVQDFGFEFVGDNPPEGLNVNVNLDHKDISELVHDSILKYTALLQK